MARPIKERIGTEEELGHEIANLMKTHHGFSIVSMFAQKGRIAIESLVKGRDGITAFKSLEKRLLQNTEVPTVSAFINHWDNDAKRIETTHRFVFSSPEIIQNQDSILDVLKPTVVEKIVNQAFHLKRGKYKDRHGRAGR